MQTDARGPRGAPEPPANAITLTYTVAPHPFCYQTIFTVLTTTAAARQHREAKGKSWLELGWSVLRQTPASSSEAAFTRYFSRQLEVRHSRVIMSASCALLSSGSLLWGLLWVTSEGLFFCSTKAIASSCSRNKNENDINYDEAAKVWSDSNKNLDDDLSAFREAVSFKNVVSMLPSIALAVSGDGAPYIAGIPNLIVKPNALQVFTISPNQIYQFVYIHSLTMVPPSTSSSLGGKTGNLFLQHEYDAVKSLPSEYDAVTFCALTERLWEERLKELQIPLCREGVEYAPRH